VRSSLAAGQNADAGITELSRSILAGCDEEQVAAITTEAKPLRVVAGAGSGKTRVLTRRIAWRIAAGEAAARHVLAITFTRKAAGELRGRLATLHAPGVTTSTFHGAAFAQLRQAALDSGRHPPAILDSKVRLLRQIVRESWADRRVADDGELITALASEIEWAKARVIRPTEYPVEARTAGRRPPVGINEVAGLFELYERALKKKGLVDFEGLLVELARMIEDDAILAQAQRWRFRHVFVDEFQDVNAAQLRLLEAWLGPNVDVCVVGDPDQSIYGWNGSDPGIMTDLDRRWPGLTTLRLSTNYRSTPEVVSAAAAALSLARQRGGQTASAIAASRPAGSVPTITVYASDRAEADGVAAALRLAHRPGRSWRQLAVLARTNAQLLAFQQACVRRDIPCRPASGPFLDRPAVRKALSALGREGRQADLSRFTSDLEQAVAIGGQHESSADGKGGQADGRENDESSEVRVGEMGAEDLLDLAALAGVCREYMLLDPAPTVAAFLAWARTYGREQPGSGPGADVVELTTFHRAKGLQWQVVFVTGLEEGLVPIGSDPDDRTEAEERRLLYVALTRAEDELHCSWAAERRFGARSVRREPSPYLRAIESACRPVGAPRGRPGGGYRTGPFGAAEAGVRTSRGGRRPPAEAASDLPSRLRALRRTAGAATGADGMSTDPLVAAIKEWRATTARAARVPAYVVMPDKTVEAIAKSRPDSVRTLLEVPGIGPSRAALYGETLLGLVAQNDADRSERG
jgi:DNA helicase-2/ATP-dependent DNA helicase PcrA